MLGELSEETRSPYLPTSLRKQAGVCRPNTEYLQELQKLCLAPWRNLHDHDKQIRNKTYPINDPDTGRTINFYYELVPATPKFGS